MISASWPMPKLAKKEVLDILTKIEKDLDKIEDDFKKAIK
jgi:hypothetical protein